MNFARAIRLCRAAFGLQQAELARNAGIGASHLSLLESGKRQPSIETIRKLCLSLGMPVDLFMMLSANPDESADMSRLSEALLKLLVAAQREEAKKSIR